MANVTQTVYSLARASNGLDVSGQDTTASASDTYLIQNNGKMFLYVTNTTGGSGTVTVATPNTVDGLAVTDLTATVADGAVRLLGPFPTTVYNNASGQISVTFSVAMLFMAVNL